MKCKVDLPRNNISYKLISLKNYGQTNHQHKASTGTNWSL